MKNILIIGATSAIAEQFARLYTQQQAKLYLVGRDLAKLTSIQQDLLVRGANAVQVAAFDANQTEAHQPLVEGIFQQLGRVDVCLIAHGSLPDQQLCQQNAEQTLLQLETNGLSVISLLTHIANLMERQGSGHISVITSVAGDRGRQSNYVYGAAKSMVSIFLQGLAQRLRPAGVDVLDIKPGFVDTPMTADFAKGPLWAQPEQVAQLIKQRIERGSSFSYTPWFWWGVMTVIKTIPAGIFNKIKL